MLFFPGTTTTATAVWGQAGNFTTSSTATSAIKFSTAIEGISVYNGSLYVVENHRGLFFQ